jgi:pimeloyl-ACP methyl ester carboxylesterase
MYVVEQEAFEPPALDAEPPLVVHRRPGGKNKHLVIFVHGLAGSRYGKRPTFGAFPRFIYEDFPQVDVGLYGYRTLQKRLKFWYSVTLEDEAGVLAGELQDLDGYECVFLMGHSMGGLLCQSAVVHLLKYNLLAPLAHIAALFLAATPQTGSQRAPALSWLNDFVVLKAHSKFVTDLRTFMQNRINVDEGVIDPGKYLLPTYAIVSASDLWVDFLSGALGLTEERLRRLHGTHTQIVKPENKQQHGYTFIAARIQQHMQLRSVPPSGMHDFEDTDARVTLDIQDRSGRIVRIEKQSALRILRHKLIEYNDDMSCSPEGRIDELSVTPGAIRRQYPHDGRYVVETTLDQVYPVGSIVRRVSSCTFHDSFIAEEEYWTQRQTYRSSRLTISVRFPKDRQPKTYVGQRREGGYLHTTQEQPAYSIAERTLIWTITKPEFRDIYQLNWTW